MISAFVLDILDIGIFFGEIRRVIYMHFPRYDSKKKKIRLTVGTGYVTESGLLKSQVQTINKRRKECVYDRGPATHTRRKYKIN